MTIHVPTPLRAYTNGQESITVDAGTARAVSDFLEVEDNKILAVGTYTDTLAKTADSWLLASKEIRLK